MHSKFGGASETLKVEICYTSHQLNNIIKMPLLCTYIVGIK